MVGLIDWSLLPVQLFQDFCHFSDISFVTRGSSSKAGDISAVTERGRKANFFSAESAFSFPGMPTWLGIQHRTMVAMVFPCFVWTQYSLINFCTRSLSMLKPSIIVCRLDSESETIRPTNFFNFDRRITWVARNKAYTSARKMLVTSGTSYAFGDAFTRSYSFAHFRAVSVYATVIRALIAKFVKTMLMNLCKNINFVSIVKGIIYNRSHEKPWWGWNNVRR